jgi:peptide/nickel transport system substrate-binding protein
MAEATRDKEKKLGYVKQAEEIFVEDAPIWFFNYNKAVLAHQPWVHGLAPVAPEMMFQDMTNVWIDETSPRANMK